MASHMQKYYPDTSQMYIVIILTSETILLVLDGRDVASGTDRHLGKKLYFELHIVEAHPLFPSFIEKCLANPTSPFFIY